MRDEFDDAFNTDVEPLMLTLCLEEQTILVSHPILEALEFPRQIQMMINESQCMLLLKACTVNDRQAIVIPQQPMLQFEISGVSLLRRIQRLTHWPDMQPRVIYGSYLPKHHAVVFALNEAQPAQLRIPVDDIPHGRR